MKTQKVKIEFHEKIQKAMFHHNGRCAICGKPKSDDSKFYHATTDFVIDEIKMHPEEFAELAKENKLGWDDVLICNKCIKKIIEE